MREKCLFAEDASNGITPSLGVILGSRVVVLGLGEAVATARSLDPGSTGVGSTLLVELVKAKELSGLLDVLFVVGSGLLGISLADLAVFFSAQTSGDIGVGADGTLLGL